MTLVTMIEPSRRLRPVTSDSSRRPPGPEPAVARDADLIVAGGGIAGVVAAELARSAGLSVILLEAAAELGGNAQLGHTGAGLPYPRGSTVLGTYTRQHRELLGRLTIGLERRYQVPADRVLLGGRWVEIAPPRRGLDDPLHRELAGLVRRWERDLGAGIELATCARDLREPALRWDDLSFDAALSEASPELRSILVTILRSDAARTSGDVSALAAITDLLVCLQGQSFFLPGGNAFIVQTLAERFASVPPGPGSVRVVTRSELVGVEEGEGGVRVRCRDWPGGLERSLHAGQLLLAVPSDVLCRLPGARLKSSARLALEGLTRGSYHLANFFVDCSRLVTHAFYLSPHTRWVTDVVQSNGAEQPAGPGDGELPSVLTAYLPGSSDSARDAVAPGDVAPGDVAERARRDLQQMFAGDARLRQALAQARCELSVFPKAMAAPAPGQLRRLHAIGSRLSPRVSCAHSDLAFFSAMGAMQMAHRCMADVVDAHHRDLQGLVSA